VNIHQGIVLSSPVNWLLLRNNEIKMLPPDAPAIVDESLASHHNHGARETLQIDH
jgi:hypothetical protein